MPMLRLKVRVQNIGKLKGDEVVQVYLLPHKVPPFKGRHPSKTLIGFLRVRDIAVGATADAVFDITGELLLLATEDGDLASVPGLRAESGERGGGGAVAAAYDHGQGAGGRGAVSKGTRTRWSAPMMGSVDFETWR